MTVLALAHVLAASPAGGVANSPDIDTGFQWRLVIACWTVVLLALAFLVLRTVQRGRKLSAQVPEDERRWM